MSTVLNRIVSVVVACWVATMTLLGQVPEGLTFSQYSTQQGLPTSKVHGLLQDSDGFIWMATYHGLYCYDGYGVRKYNASIDSPNRLINNNVLALCEDRKHRLWIGTEEGLSRLDLHTGQMRDYTLSNVARPRIQHIVQTRDGNLYFAFLRGVYRYDEGRDTLYLLAGQGFNGPSPENANCQSLLEDADGDLFISTWANGLYRYIPSEHRFIHYDMPGEGRRQISHQRLLRDTYGNIWLGTYGYGLLRLTFSTDKQELHIERYIHSDEDATSLLSDHVLSFVEHPKDHLIWVGTRLGISVMQVDALGKPHFINYSDDARHHYFPEHEVNDVICDSEGMIWLATDNGGVFHTNLNSSLFNTLSPRELTSVATNSVEGVYVDKESALWIAAGYNVAYIRGKEARPVFDEKAEAVKVQGVFHSERTDEVLVSLRDRGLAVCSEGREVGLYRQPQAAFLPSNNIHYLTEDKEGNWWIATYRGLGVRYADGTNYAYAAGRGDSLLGCDMVHVAVGIRGDVWLSTSSHGIVRLSGNLHDPKSCQVEHYSIEAGTLPGNSVLFVYIDRRGHVWAGLESAGLCLYDEQSRRFEAVHRQYNLPGDMVTCMEQDSVGNYWLGTDNALVYMSLDSLNLGTMHIFSGSDGLPGNFINLRSSYQSDGMLYFGCNQGLVYFRPFATRIAKRDVVCRITDLMLNGISLSQLPDEERNAITTKHITHSEAVTLSSKYDNFEVKFSALSYNMPQHNRYAYRLVGFDNVWRYVDAGNRVAYYDHLPAGAYTFEVKGSNENGDWSQVCRLKITLTPPWWLSWWAYIIYMCLGAAVLGYILHTIKNKVMLRNALRVQKLENEKVEELNHVKLQFFANITHELVTPLTIISASLEELKSQMNGENELIETMDVNVRRLVRLLQQILEFRKAETGNLQLRVAEGDIALFLRHEVESFIPLIRQHHLEVSVQCQQEVMRGYFDPDKVDKIVYNLLSNAAKYTESGGNIVLKATYTDGRRNVLLQVSDTGRGMSEQQQKGLFRRFYEGDYRQSHTIGTGIGLSLVHDLVLLHRGTIQVESKVGQGTTFSIELPIEADAYDPQQIIQIDDPKPGVPLVLDDADAAAAVAEEEEVVEENDAPKILLVEDNEELRSVMQRLLRREFNVLLASDGLEALHIMHTDDVSLVVSDVIMPNMDGMEMTRRAKADVEVCHIPIILLTAKRTEEDRDAGYLAGADAYLTKPFSLSVLLARIHNLLRSRQRDADSFKDEITLDLQNLHYTDIDQEFLARAIACIHNHLSDTDFEVAQFASEMASSRSTLYKKLRSLTNLNPSGFIRNIRLKAACQIMESNPNLRVNEVAYSVGFNDPKYFSNCFRKEFGMLPTEYCKIQMERPALDDEGNYG